MAAFWAKIAFGGCSPAVTAHGSLVQCKFLVYFKKFKFLLFVLLCACLSLGLSVCLPASLGLSVRVSVPVGLGRAVREVRLHSEERRFESQRWQ
jgi:hypothetical protein